MEGEEDAVWLRRATWCSFCSRTKNMVVLKSVIQSPPNLFLTWWLFSRDGGAYLMGSKLHVASSKLSTLWLTAVPAGHWRTSKYLIAKHLEYALT
jgi:hypothetical protein